jgi:hypothetical protein
MAGELHEIHENRLSARGYGKLAQKVEAEVGNIVANCKLGAQGRRAVAHRHRRTARWHRAHGRQFKGGKRQNGAVQVIGALKYAAYFDDRASSLSSTKIQVTEFAGGQTEKTVPMSAFLRTAGSCRPRLCKNSKQSLFQGWFTLPDLKHMNRPSFCSQFRAPAWRCEADVPTTAYWKC